MEFWPKDTRRFGDLLFGGIETLLRCLQKKEERERAPHRERESACAAPWDKVYAAVTKSFGETF
jgi:hypothetical protein